MNNGKDECKLWQSIVREKWIMVYIGEGWRELEGKTVNQYVAKSEGGLRLIGKFVKMEWVISMDFVFLLA